MTIKYIVELRGWNGIALPAVHARDAKIYVDDPGPYIIGFPTEARYAVRPPSEVCIVDLDINYLNCATPPSGAVSTKHQRDKFRQIILTAFGPNYHSDHGVPSELKEAFPAGRFRPICKIQAKRGAASTAVADMIKAPEWWHSTRIIQAFDQVLQDKFKKPSLFKRISSFGSYRRAPQLSAAEQLIQLSIRKRATAFVDARDDLETKIGRLSRRLNFLMTESDLWRDKFVTFEQYAEKLSLEAQDLRAKVNKEQREAKRLSGIVSTANGEKVQLQTRMYFSSLWSYTPAFLSPRNVPRPVSCHADENGCPPLFVPQNSRKRRTHTVTPLQNLKRCATRWLGWSKRGSKWSPRLRLRSSVPWLRCRSRSFLMFPSIRMIPDQIPECRIFRPILEGPPPLVLPGAGAGEEVPARRG